MAPLPEISNDAVLTTLTDFNVRYSRKVNISFQSWEFSHGHTVEFLTSQGPDERRALIRKASDLVRTLVLLDIQATMPEIEATIGDQPQVVETLKRSLGLL